MYTIPLPHSPIPLKWCPHGHGEIFSPDPKHYGETIQYCSLRCKFLNKKKKCKLDIMKALND
jgi:hypothetical protein